MGGKYEPILPKWTECIKAKCADANLVVHNKINTELRHGHDYAWWDVVRLHNNIEIMLKTGRPVVHVDIDVIVEKDIRPLVDLDYDIIISTEIGGDSAYPTKCSKVLGFGMCSGFYAIKPAALKFLIRMLASMKNQQYGTYSDQVTIMNYIVNSVYKLSTEEVVFDGIKYTNRIIEIDGIKICVIDFNAVIRDPIVNAGQFANHINIDNVGGTQNFLRYFDEDLEKLPLTCRCGKTHLGDHGKCPHIAMRG